MKYSIRMDFDTDIGRKQMEEDGQDISKCLDETHVSGMKDLIVFEFGGIAGFINYEVIKED